MFRDTRLRKKRHRAFKWFMLITTLFLSVLLGRGVWHMYGTYKESVARRELIEERYQELTAHVARTKTSVEALETQQGREAEIRESFSMAKAGERMAVIVEHEKKEVEPAPPPPWYVKLWRGSWFGIGTNSR